MIRWVTALVLLGLILGALYLGGGWWLGFVAGFLAVAGLEWGRMGESQPLLVSVVILLGFGLLVIRPVSDPLYIVALLAGLMLVPLVPLILSQDPFRVRDWIWIGTGLLWLSVPAALLFQLREEAGVVLLIVMLAATAFQDTVALYIGQWFGEPGTLCPGLSPNKSRAGGVANVIGAIGCFVIGAWWVGGEVSTYVFVGLLIGISGQLGDLLLSALKRRVQLDDSGGFLPGHGGVLDRADGLLANSVVFFLLLPLLDQGLL